ncbi:MAG: phosphatase PAP2 family protein [Verrucomicrobiales bacterium]|nr:phosphatase PAP2 family protein [Verrucomicrobiales bacterium]
MKALPPRPGRDISLEKKGYWILAGLTLGLLVLCGLFDLQIARAAYEPESRFGLFLRKFGEYPGHALILVSSGVYLVYGRRLAIRLLMLVPFCLEIYIFIEKHHPVASRIEGLFVWFLLLFPLAAILGAQRFMTRAAMARSAGLVVLAGVLHPLFLVQILKKLWGRARFNNLEEGVTHFTPWYLPQGINDHHSFPSGHTAMGVMACFLVLYFPPRLRAVAFVPLFAWAIAVAASRVILGAHYASDVVFSLSIGLGLLFSFHRITADQREC